MNARTACPSAARVEAPASPAHGPTPVTGFPAHDQFTMIRGSAIDTNQILQTVRRHSEPGQNLRRLALLSNFPEMRMISAQYGIRKKTFIQIQTTEGG